MSRYDFSAAREQVLRWAWLGVFLGSVAGALLLSPWMLGLVAFCFVLAEIEDDDL